MKKNINKILAASMAASILLCSCDSVNESSNSSSAKKSENTASSTSERTEVGAFGATVSVADIKDSFNYNDDAIMPLYNIGETESIDFDFHFDYMEADCDLYDYVSIHTEPTCKEESEVYYGADIVDSDENGFKLVCSPMMSIMQTEYQKEKTFESWDDEEIEDVEFWGNAPIYYACVHYDLSADTAKKLDSPVIIPFTIKKDVNAPEVRYSIDEQGILRLNWEPIEGAEKYNIYYLIDDPSEQSTGEKNTPVKGAEIGFENETLLLMYETDTNSFSEWGSHEDGLNVVHNDLDGQTSIISQNLSVSSDIYISAVANEVESGFSAPVKTSELLLPYQLTDESNDILSGIVESMGNLPDEVDVLNIDGSITKRKVSFTEIPDYVFLGEYKEVAYRYNIEGTALDGVIVPEDENGWTESPETETSDITGNAEPDNNIDMRPDNDIETIIESAPTDDEDNDPDEKPEDESKDESIISQQTENTEKHVENGNKETVENAPEGIYINADSAEEEWLALNMVQGNTEFSLEAFPSLQDPYALSDTITKTYHQNPYVLGVTGYSYDYKNFVLHVDYSYTQDEIKKCQEEMAEKADAILAEIITDDMDSEAKALAIYDYLNDNAVYNNEALEAGESRGFKAADLTDFKDSFSTYGILCEGKGVCQSYANTFKLLGDLCGLDAIVVTGYLNGTCPHAWNMINIDDMWYEIDCTNNETNIGIPYFLYEADEETASKNGFTKSELFEIDEVIPQYTENDSSKEFYKKNNLTASNADDYKDILVKSFNENTKCFAVRYDGVYDKEEMSRIITLAFNELGIEDKLPSVKFGVSGGFMVLMLG